MEKMDLALISAPHQQTYTVYLPTHLPNKTLTKRFGKIFRIYKANMLIHFTVDALVHHVFIFLL